MPKRNQLVVPHAEGWAVKKEGSKRATAVFRTQGEAIEYGRTIAINQRCELVIHDCHGKVRKRRNYTKPRKSRYEFLQELREIYRISLERSQRPSDNALNN